MDHPEIILFLARAKNGVIGNAGEIPWRIPADQRRFKQLTMGKPMIMGRKTFDSLPGLLEGRRHIVLTHDTGWEEEGAEVARSVEEALRMSNAPHVAVIGGAEIYRLFLPHADKIELTEVDLEPDGDTIVAPFDDKIWQETAREAHPVEDSRPGYSFVTLVRKDAL